MILERLHLQRFGPFRDDEFEFAAGLNVVRGPNEAGKSHLREAIVRLLFDQKKVNTQASDVKRWTTWSEDREFALAGEFSVGDERWRIEKDFAEDTILLAAADGSQALHDDSSVNERLHELLGENAREVYVSTACVEQQDFVHLRAGRQVGELLQQTVTGGADDTNVQNVMKRLSDALGEMNRGTTRHADRPGPIQTAKNQLAEIEDELQELRPRVEQVEQARSDLDVQRERLQALQAELEEKRRLAEAAQRRLDLQNELEELQDRARQAEQEYRRARELNENITDLNKELAELPDLSDEDMEEAREIRRRLEDELTAAEKFERSAAELQEEAAATAKALAEAEASMPSPDALARAEELAAKLADAQRDARDASERRDTLEAERRRAASQSLRAFGLLIGGLALVVGGLALGWAVSAPLFAIAGVGLGLLVAGFF
ncbi:MAG: AAA family ATPase, partial [Armatimonadetes bacterium]|nr:AAA family ATPase [Armatimonadota bacterium]